MNQIIISFTFWVTIQEVNTTFTTFHISVIKLQPSSLERLRLFTQQHVTASVRIARSYTKVQIGKILCRPPIYQSFSCSIIPTLIKRHYTCKLQEVHCLLLAMQEFTTINTVNVHERPVYSLNQNSYEVLLLGH